MICNQMELGELPNLRLSALFLHDPEGCSASYCPSIEVPVKRIEHEFCLVSSVIHLFFGHPVVVAETKES